MTLGRPLLTLRKDANVEQGPTNEGLYAFKEADECVLGSPHNPNRLSERESSVSTMAAAEK
jgi:hypothetical protein